MLLLTMLLSACTQPSSPPLEEPPQLVGCVDCHGISGVARRPGMSNINGRSEAQLMQALREYQSGVRDNSIMRASVARYSDQELEALAHWYAAQPAEPAP